MAIVFTETDTNGVVAQGAAFTVELKGNPTTGFAWSFNREESSSNLDAVVEFMSSPEMKFVVNQHQPGMVGVGGTFLCEMRAKSAKGSCKLVFQYARSWEKTVPPSKSFTLMLEVQ